MAGQDQGRNGQMGDDALATKYSGNYLATDVITFFNMVSRQISLMYVTDVMV